MRAWKLRKTGRRWAVILLLALACLPGCAKQQMEETKVNDAGAVRAPELEPNLGWINTDRPLRLKEELKGQVVLLDFWTYCCINCMQILPDLEYLEKKYASQPFIVIGVHSAKFENEEGRETIEAAVQRYKIHHPVVIDDDMGIWQRYTVQAWPTFMLIGSDGRIMGMASGEGNREVLDASIALALETGRKNGTLASHPLKIAGPADIKTTSPLRFPGKVLADEKGGRLFIADSNHNRVVISSLPDDAGQARLVGVIGSRDRGKTDGAFGAATFHNPQGLALVGDVLYIADTDNHSVRAADLRSSQVTTVAGTGVQGYDRRGGNPGPQQQLASPWALEVDLARNRLFIAMAGTHQIWTYDLAKKTAQAFSGSGRENIFDGSATEAALAQPSGMALLGENLYVADSEVSGIRQINAATGAVKTVVGRGLFVFGDVDGRGDTVRLQHPLGVTTHEDTLLIADTYNHKIKQITPATRQVKTLYGTGRPGQTDGAKPAFFEPGGLDASAGNLYVADTNNHRVIKINLNSGAWSEVKIEGLKGE